MPHWRGHVPDPIRNKTQRPHHGGNGTLRRPLHHPWVSSTRDHWMHNQIYRWTGGFRSPPASSKTHTSSSGAASQPVTGRPPHDLQQCLSYCAMRLTAVSVLQRGCNSLAPAPPQQLPRRPPPSWIGKPRHQLRNLGLPSVPATCSDSRPTQTHTYSVSGIFTSWGRVLRLRRSEGKKLRSAGPSGLRVLSTSLEKPSATPSYLSYNLYLPITLYGN